MNYELLLEKFKDLGIYHLILAVITQIGMIMSIYVILSLPFEKRFPLVYCKEKLIESPYEICNSTKFCSNKYDTYIDYSESIDNWTISYNLMYDREIYSKPPSSFFLWVFFQILYQL